MLKEMFYLQYEYILKLNTFDILCFSSALKTKDRDWVLYRDGWFKLQSETGVRLWLQTVPTFYRRKELGLFSIYYINFFGMMYDNLCKIKKLSNYYKLVIMKSIKMLHRANYSCNDTLSYMTTKILNNILRIT